MPINCDFCFNKISKEVKTCMNCTSISCHECYFKCTKCDNVCCKSCVDDQIGFLSVESNKNKKRTIINLYYYCYLCK